MEPWRHDGTCSQRKNILYDRLLLFSAVIWAELKLVVRRSTFETKETILEESAVRKIKPGSTPIRKQKQREASLIWKKKVKL